MKKPRTEAELQAHRTLKGVMRVGDLAKGLLLQGDRSLHVVVLCSVKPTTTLFKRVYDALPKYLQVSYYLVINEIMQSNLTDDSCDGFLFF